MIRPTSVAHPEFVVKRKSCALLLFALRSHGKIATRAFSGKGFLAGLLERENADFPRSKRRTTRPADHELGDMLPRGHFIEQVRITPGRMKAGFHGIVVAAKALPQPPPPQTWGTWRQDHHFTPTACTRSACLTPRSTRCGRQLSTVFSPLCVFQKRQVTLVGLVDVGLACHFPGRVHGKHGHA